MTDIELAAIPAGSIDVRNGLGAVRLESFEIGVYPVTEELVAELIGEPSVHPRRPAVELSWLRAVRLCNAASEWEGLDLAYGFDGEHVTWHRDSEGYRLPTEAEWEFAWNAGSNRVSAAHSALASRRRSTGSSLPAPARGGGFADEVWNVRADVRRGAPPRSSHDDVGLRLARSTA